MIQQDFITKMKEVVIDNFGIVMRLDEQDYRLNEEEIERIDFRFEEFKAEMQNPSWYGYKIPFIEIVDVVIKDNGEIDVYTTYSNQYITDGWLETVCEIKRLAKEYTK